MNALLSQDHLDAIRTIIERVAHAPDVFNSWENKALSCLFCNATAYPDGELKHAPDCPVTLARNLLASAGSEASA